MVGLRARGQQRLGVAPLLPVDLAVRRRLGRLAQLLEARQQPLALLALVEPQPRLPQGVRGGGVPGLALDGQAQQLDGLLCLALGQQQLCQEDARGHVAGVELQHAPEGGLRVRTLVLRAPHQAQHVLGRGRVGQGLGGGPRLLLRPGQVVGEQQRQREVDPGEGQCGVGRQRGAEGRRGLLGLELLQQGHATVVGAASVFVAGEVGRDRRRAVAQRRQEYEARGQQQRSQAQGSSCRPAPSRTTTVRPAATSRAVSTCPPGQRTSSAATRRSLPRPKVSGRSLCDR